MLVLLVVTTDGWLCFVLNPVCIPELDVTTLTADTLVVLNLTDSFIVVVEGDEDDKNEFIVDGYALYTMDEYPYIVDESAFIVDEDPFIVGKDGPVKQINVL